MSASFYQPSWSAQFAPDLTVAESTRLGGVSHQPYYSLNLGLYTDDEEVAIQRNREIFCAALNWSSDELAGAYQIHEDKVLRVHKPGQWQGYDALMTNKLGVLLSVTIADCTPVLIYDPVQQAVGAAHAGWRGTVAQIGRKLLRNMQDAYGTRSADCWVFIGTCIAADDFEVDADVADHFEAPFKRWDASRGKFFVDLKRANAHSLYQAGVPEQQVECSTFSTVKDNSRYFSHRAEKGLTGRMLAVIGLR